MTGRKSGGRSIGFSMDEALRNAVVRGGALKKKTTEDEKFRSRGQLFLFIEIVLMFAICVVHAYEAGQYADFFPINGTFQNFNPVRRLLHGQVPYRDFVDYLGMGHLYAGALMTVIFGGDYRASLVAFSFLALFSLAALSIMIGKAIFRDWKTVVGITDFVLILLLTQPRFFVNALGMTEDIINALNASLNTGNSARMMRGMIMPICTGIFAVFSSGYKCRSRSGHLKVGRLAVLAGVGCMAAFAFIWSNDYGISCWVCISIMVFWISFSRKRNILCAVTNMLIEMIFSTVGIFLLVEAVTLGHLGEWMDFTIGTGAYQSWYYQSPKSWYVLNVDFSWIMLVQAGMVIVYLLLLFAKRGTLQSIGRYGIPGFANMACFCAANEYRLLSGDFRREVALSVLFFSVLYEAISLIVGSFKSFKSKKLRDGFLLASLVVSVSWLVSSAQNMVLSYMNRTGTYVASMGGNMRDHAGDLESTHAFLDGAGFWSTYASAQEVVEGTFQPSGTDYIIHVLGDGQREKYLDAFLTGDFKYVATIRKEFSGYEYWCERANWFFYRELYRNWHPVFENTYAQYWKRNDEEGENTLFGDHEVNMTRIDRSTVKISIQTDESVNGVADVYIDYSVDKKNGRKAKLLIQRSLKVENSGAITAAEPSFESNWLREESGEYVPMPIVNGYGELTLSAYPLESTTLNLKDASCESIYTIVR